MQPYTVTALGKEIKLIRAFNVGLTQGGPASPALYNKISNVLIRRMLYSLKIVDEGTGLAPLKAFADEIAM